MSLVQFFKLSSQRISPKERSPEVQERFNKIIENYILSSRVPNIKDFNQNFQSLSDEEKYNIVNQMSNIDRETFGSKYPEEDFATSTYDILDSLDIEAKPYGFYMHVKDDPNKVCGYIYGSDAKNHIMNSYEVSYFKGFLKKHKVSDIKDIVSSLNSGKIFYVENLATTSLCGSGLLPSGSLLMIEMVKVLKQEGYKYIYAEFLSDSYEVIKSAKSSNIFSKLGVQLILDIADSLDEGDIYPRAKVLLKIN